MSKVRVTMENNANKLDRKETIESFHKLTTKYGVLDHSKSGGGHDRFYLGKEGRGKPMFLACSRVGWMCIYCDLSEKVILENNGFKCVQNTSNDDNYEYRAHVDFEDFDKFLKLVQGHLGRLA